MVFKDNEVAQPVHLHMLQTLVLRAGAAFINRPRPIPFIHVFVRDAVPMEAITTLVMNDGGQLESRDHLQRTPLFMILETAKRYPQFNILPFLQRLTKLLELGCKVDAICGRGRTTLHEICADYKHLGGAVVAEIAARWPQLTQAIDSVGFTPLALACMPIDNLSVGVLISGPAAVAGIAINDDISNARPVVRTYVAQLLHSKLHGGICPDVPSDIMASCNQSAMSDSVFAMAASLLDYASKCPPHLVRRLASNVSESFGVQLNQMG